MSRWVLVWVFMIVGSLVSRPSFANTFTMPRDGDVLIQCVGGTGAATSNFGLGHSTSDFQPFLFGIPQQLGGEVDVGHFTKGQVVPFAMVTNYLGTFYAYSTDSVTPASRTAFMDLDNSLGMGGGVIRNTSTDHYQLVLDDAASFGYDDNDNDLLINVRIAPEPSAIGLLGVCAVGLMGRRR